MDGGINQQVNRVVERPGISLVRAWSYQTLDCTRCVIVDHDRHIHGILSNPHE